MTVTIQTLEPLDVSVRNNGTVDVAALMGTLDADVAATVADALTARDEAQTARDDAAASATSAAAGATSSAASAESAAASAALAEEIVGLPSESAAVVYLVENDADVQGALTTQVAGGKYRNVKSYGAAGDYNPLTSTGTDDTTAIAAAAAACSSGDVLYFPKGYYKTTAAVAIPAGVELLGDGVRGLFGSISTFDSINTPIIAPHLAGSVLVQTGAAQHGFTFAGVGATNPARGIGVLFHGAHRFTNTGHGFYAYPTAYSGHRDNGVMRSKWNDLMVFGHDGNHYAYWMTNGIYNTFDHLGSWGGGVLMLENDGASGAHYGNLVGTSIYGQLFVDGSAHGIRLLSTAEAMFSIHFVRPQVTISADYDTMFGVTGATTSQHMFMAEDHVVWALQIDSPDFESTIGATAVIPKWSNLTDGGWPFAGQLPRVDRKDYAGGNIVTSETLWAAAHTATDVTLSARGGDWFEIGMQALTIPNAGAYVWFDVATIVSGSPVRYASSQSATQRSGGVPGWAAWDRETGVGGTVNMYLTDGDIAANGTVTFRLMMRTAGGGVTIRADGTNNSLVLHARNLTRV